VCVALRGRLGAGGVTFAGNTGTMATTDDGLDATSRKLLDEVEELRRLELAKRRTARSSPEFHDLATKVDDAARHVFDTAGSQLIDGQADSPLPSEREEQHPGDWTEGTRPESAGVHTSKGH
jgi:hypothetical protein